MVKKKVAVLDEFVELDFSNLDNEDFTLDEDDSFVGSKRNKNTGKVKKKKVVQCIHCSFYLSLCTPYLSKGYIWE